MNTGIYPPGYNTPLGQYTTDYLQNAQQRRQWEERKAEAARKALPPEDPIDTIRKNFSSTMIEHIKWGELEQLLKNFKPEDIGLRTKDGYSLLYVTIRYSFDLEAQTLIQNGANPAVIEANGQTSLHIATEKNFTLLAYKCLLKGAPKNHKDAQRLTPLDIANRNQNADLIALFRLWPDTPLNSSRTPNIIVTGLQPANDLPQQLQFAGNGSFLLQLDEQPINLNWGVSTFPHLQATLIHPLQISEREFSTLLQNRRLVLVTSENGALKASCSTALKTTITRVGNVPIILRWHVRHPLPRTEHFLIKLGNITPIEDLKTQNCFLEQVYRGLTPAQIIQRTTDHHLQFLNEKDSDYLPLARAVKPGNMVKGNLDEDKRGAVRFKFYSSESGNIHVKFSAIYFNADKQVHLGCICSPAPIKLDPKDPKSISGFESAIRRVYQVARGRILVHQGAFNPGPDEIHQGSTERRQVLSDALFQNKTTQIERFNAKGVKIDYSETSNEAVVSIFFPQHTDRRPFPFPSKIGILHIHDETLDTRFVFDGGEFDYPINGPASQVMQLFETDRLLDAVSQKKEGPSLKADWIEVFQNQVKRLSIGSFAESYISYCELRLANRFDLMFGQEGYFAFFSKSSQLPRLCRRYNLPEQTGNGLKSLFSFNAGELDVLKDAIKKNEHSIVQSLQKVYEHLKERKVELESYVGILEAIAPQSRRLKEFQEKLTLFHRRLQAIHDELKQAGLIKV